MTRPYEVGQTLRLHVLVDHIEGWDSDLSVTVLGIHDTLFQQVLDVIYDDHNGHTGRATLKIFDCRFAKGLRTMVYTREGEAQMRHLVRTVGPHGAANFLKTDLELRRRDSPSRFLSDELPRPELLFHSYKPDERAKHELALHFNCCRQYRIECKAYQNLQPLQGKGVPTQLAVGCVQRNDLPGGPEDQPRGHFHNIYFRLTRHIEGYKLWDIATSPLAPSDPERLPAIIQAATNTVEAINDLGILMDGFGVRRSNRHIFDPVTRLIQSVIVDADTGEPFFTDFIMCDFRRRTWFGAYLIDSDIE